MYKSDFQTEDVFKRIAAMRLIEDAPAYQCRAYFAEKNSTSSSSAAACIAVNSGCRAKMIDWTYSIVDYCGFDRETVITAASLIDRFFSQQATLPKEVLNDRRQYQLYCMTALHVAIKLRERMNLDCDLLSRISRGTYTAYEFLEAECHLMSQLDWRLNAPTSMEFVHEFISLLPKHSISPSVEAKILDFAQRQSQHATREYDFVTTKQFSVALAALINAIEATDYNEFPLQLREELFELLRNATDSDDCSEDIFETRLRLQGKTIPKGCCLFRQQDVASSERIVHASKIYDDFASLSKADSPVSVSRLAFSQGQ